MNKKITIQNNPKSRRGFLRDITKWVGGTALLASASTVISSKSFAADGPNNTATASEPFTGGISIAGFNFAPRGWAFCDGQLLPVAQNTALFSLLGTTYGGDGRTTFALPNLQGRFAMHSGRGPGLTPRRLGERVGTETITLNESNIPSHNHTLRVNSNGGNSENPTNNSIAANSEGIKHYSSSGATWGTPSDTITNTGGGAAFNNMPPYLIMNYIIALVGTYPSRS